MILTFVYFSFFHWDGSSKKTGDSSVEPAPTHFFYVQLNYYMWYTNSLGWTQGKSLNILAFNVSHLLFKSKLGQGVLFFIELHLPGTMYQHLLDQVLFDQGWIGPIVWLPICLLILIFQMDHFNSNSNTDVLHL